MISGFPQVPALFRRLFPYSKCGCCTPSLTNFTSAVVNALVPMSETIRVNCGLPRARFVGAGQCNGIV